MEIETLEMLSAEWRVIRHPTSIDFSPQVVFVFGDTDVIKCNQHFSELRTRYPAALILGCSSSGNIMGVELSRSPLVATAVQFSSSRVRLAYVDAHENDTATQFETRLMEKVNELHENDIKHLFLLADGLKINGSDLVGAINKVAKVPVTGGLAGDGARFAETWVIANDFPQQNRVAVLAFYGHALKTSYGCFAGWSEFGAERQITKSRGNVLYEIDGLPALDLYKKYLGDYGKDLPISGLRFPLSIKEKESDPELIRTLLAINETDKSITFAGDVPEGYRARLMKPDLDILIGGAGLAAKEVQKGNEKTALGLVVSCVGRKIVMGQLVEEELDAVEKVLGRSVQLSGFYSYGEIAPFKNNLLTCNLHNQTMTLTAIYED